MVIQTRKGILKNIYLSVELALEYYDARTKYKQNSLGDLRSSGEAVTCLFEVPKLILFLYMKPGCLELWVRVASRDKSECINYCKKHKVTQTKKTSIQAFGCFFYLAKTSIRAILFYFCEHLENLCASIRATA